MGFIDVEVAASIVVLQGILSITTAPVYRDAIHWFRERQAANICMYLPSRISHRPDELPCIGTSLLIVRWASDLNFHIIALL